MEKAIQRLYGFEQLNIFGVRHLSPASAFHLLKYLDEIRPKCVLIEGPSDASDLIPQMADNRIKPPFALLSYTTNSPVKSVLYPFATYSPEYQAIKWAVENYAKAWFIDLPTCVTMKFDRKESVAITDFYSQVYKLADEPDYESFWERHFEHCLDTSSFMEKTNSLSNTLRDMSWQAEEDTDKMAYSYNLIRESFMKSRILKAIEQGYKLSEIVVVTGAYHINGILADTLPISEEEEKLLPKENVKITLMPYSYYRLSSQSGYGAGNKAPEYFGLLWECLNGDNLERLASIYLSKIGAVTRDGGNYNSTASVIEAVRLSKGLSSMRKSPYPTLKDLHDSSVCLLGNGELAAVSEAFARVDIGTAMGELPEGLSQSPVQDDMNRLLKKLKLEKYKTVVAQDLLLDLRENRKVKSEEAAFIDLNRSIFFNRLKLLNIHFATFSNIRDSSAWSEKWILQWSPEAEIEIVEATLKGETIENAAAFVLKEQLEQADKIADVATILDYAFLCNLLSEVPNAILRMQTLCIDASNFMEVSLATYKISNIIAYKDIRNIDSSLLIPILQQLFLRAVLVMYDNANCDDNTAADFISAIDKMHNVSQQQFEYINDEQWLKNLKLIAFSDNRNAKISGATIALLMELNQITDEELRVEMSRRLSYGVPGDIAAMWFEGLSSRNRYALLSRLSIWKQLDSYLDSLTLEEFKRSLVFLRRTFGSFSPKEKSTMIDILADIWQVDTSVIGEFLQNELTETEKEKIDALNDFDFSDF